MLAACQKSGEQICRRHPRRERSAPRRPRPLAQLVSFLSSKHLAGAWSHTALKSPCKQTRGAQSSTATGPAQASFRLHSIPLKVGCGSAAQCKGPSRHRP